MNVRWIHSNESALFLLAISVVAVGTLSALVVSQQRDQGTAYGPVYLGTVPSADASPRASAPVPATIADTPTKVIPPEPTAVLAMPALQIPQKQFQPKTHPRRQAHPVVAPHQPAPAISTPATEPAAPASIPDPARTPRQPYTPTKSGPSTGISGMGNSTAPENSFPYDPETPSKKSTPNPAIKPASPAESNNSHPAASSAPTAQAPTAPTPAPAKVRTSVRPGHQADVINDTTT
jgi:hypothetical protein